MQSHGLIQFLAESFKNKTIKTTYQDATQDWLRQQEYTRVFNVHKPPLEKTYLRKTWECYFDKPLLIGSPVLRQIKCVKGEGSDHYEFLALKDSVRVQRLVEAIVTRACNDLVDTRGHIKRELIHLLGWGQFNAEIQKPAVIAKIIRSYVESVMGGMLTEVSSQANKDFSAREANNLLYLHTCINRIAQNYYDQFIAIGIADAVHFDPPQDFAAKFVVALPNPVTESLISALMKQDLHRSHAASYAALHKAYSAFWIHVLLECLALKRFDVLDVMVTELRRYVRVGEISVDLRSQYEFCIEQIMLLTLVTNMNNSSSVVNDVDQVEGLQRVFAIRDHHITMTAIITEYMQVSVRQRNFMEGDILTRFEQGALAKNGNAARSLLERLSVAESECFLHQIQSSEFAKIILKYKIFFAARVEASELVARLSSEQASLVRAAYSNAETIRQVGLHRVATSSAPEASASNVTMLEAKVEQGKIFR
jgi:hypothetical protein